MLSNIVTVPRADAVQWGAVHSALASQTGYPRPDVLAFSPKRGARHHRRGRAPGGFWRRKRAIMQNEKSGVTFTTATSQRMARTQEILLTKHNYSP